jgi:hypothetical protein
MRRSARALLPWLSFVALLGAASWTVVFFLATYYPRTGAVLLVVLVAAAFLPPARTPSKDAALPQPAETTASGSVASESGAHTLDQLG